MNISLKKKKKKNYLTSPLTWNHQPTLNLAGNHSPYFPQNLNTENNYNEVHHAQLVDSTVPPS
jgi:hypothetical protein